MRQKSKKWIVSEIFEPEKTAAESKKLSINELAEEDRPREKLMAQGASALSKAELLAILIGSGTPKTAFASAAPVLEWSSFSFAFSSGSKGMENCPHRRICSS